MLVIPTEPVQGIKRECKALPLTVRQMIVQQVQLQAIKTAGGGKCPTDSASMPLWLRPRSSNMLHIRILHFLLLMCHWSVCVVVVKPLQLDSLVRCWNIQVMPDAPEESMPL